MGNTAEKKKDRAPTPIIVVWVIVFVALFVFVLIPCFQNGFTSRVWQKPSEEMVYHFDGEFVFDEDNNITGDAYIALQTDGNMKFYGTMRNKRGASHDFTEIYDIKGDYGTKLFYADWWITKKNAISFLYFRPAKEDGAEFFNATLIHENGKETTADMWISDSVLYMNDDRFVRVR